MQPLSEPKHTKCFSKRNVHLSTCSMPHNMNTHQTLNLPTPILNHWNLYRTWPLYSSVLSKTPSTSLVDTSLNTTCFYPFKGFCLIFLLFPSSNINTWYRQPMLSGYAFSWYCFIIFTTSPINFSSKDEVYLTNVCPTFETNQVWVPLLESSIHQYQIICFCEV